MNREKQPRASIERKLFLLFQADSAIANAEANRMKSGNHEESEASKLLELKTARRRLNRELRYVSPLLAIAKTHVDHLQSAECDLETVGVKLVSSRKRYGALTVMEIGKPRLKKAINRVNRLAEQFQTDNVQAASGDSEKNINSIKLTALEAEAFDILARAEDDVVPTDVFTKLVKDWRRKSNNAKYNLISALKLKLRGSGIRLINEFKKGYRLSGSIGRINDFIKSAEIISDPYLTEKINETKVSLETASMEANCMEKHLQGKTVGEIADELNLTVNIVAAMIKSAALKQQLGL